MSLHRFKCSEINNDDLQVFLQDQDKYNFIDVRTNREYSEGHIRGFINIDYYQLIRNSDILQDIKKDKPTIVMCESGERSEGACKVLKRNGYNEIYNHTYGLIHWDGEILHK